jgi:pyridoxal phosphate enzyme (YggS family)
MTINGEIASNIESVRETISQAAADSDRSPTSITLIGVSKQQPDDRIEASLTAGLRVFGENRVQEAEIRWANRRKHILNLELHLIGPLQSNKVRAAVRLFDIIQTIDRPRIAETVSRIIAEEGRKLSCYVQVNTGEEKQKAGVLPSEAEAFVKACIEDYRLNVTGLMCIPPAADAPAPHFAFLKAMADRLNLPNISMGMSADYPAAIQLGATHIRVGSAIFGNRLPHDSTTS